MGTIRRVTLTDKDVNENVDVHPPIPTRPSHTIKQGNSREIYAHERTHVTHTHPKKQKNRRNATGRDPDARGEQKKKKLNKKETEKQTIKIGMQKSFL